MRSWSLGPGDPLALTLAADFRLCNPDYVNDHIWELEIGGGDPPALSMRTTYGLRARSMRIFPRFSLPGNPISDPLAFHLQPRLRAFHPNSLCLECAPFTDINVSAEYWVPDSHSLAGRYTITNQRPEPVNLLFELCGQLNPLDGFPLVPTSMHSTNVLSGSTAGLSPLIFLTGGPQAGPGPYPALALDLVLAASASRTFTWVQAALASPEASFNLARLTAARPWEAEQARIELTASAQTMEIHTGDPDWDAAFALSQKTAFSLFFGASSHLPRASFVLTRLPDQGYSPRGNGSDHPHTWSGQGALEAVYMAGVLPGAPELAAGIVQNFVASAREEGALDSKPGLAGQRGHWLSAPLIAGLAWRIYEQTRDVKFLGMVQPALEAFFRRWLDRLHDRDGDGFPEWDHTLQAGLEDSPAYSVWLPGGHGADITCTESPGLAALLDREARALAAMAEVLDQPGKKETWLKEAARLGGLVEACRSATGFYRRRDRDTHFSPAGKTLRTRIGGGLLSLDHEFPHPLRLLIRLELKGEGSRPLEVCLRGRNGAQEQVECLERGDFQWGPDLAVATSRKVFNRISEVEVGGCGKRDRVVVSVMDCTRSDLSLFLPLAAAIPEAQAASSLAARLMETCAQPEAGFGLPLCMDFVPEGRSKADFRAVFDPNCQGIHLPWNILVGEGLLAYGLRSHAAQLISRLMAAVIQNLKQRRSFFRLYHSGTGSGLGERNSLQGLAPLGFFLDTLGVRIESPWRLSLCGKNPFPWPVTVKYKGLTVTRRMDQTLVVFPDQQTIEVDDPGDRVIFLTPATEGAAGKEVDK